jgi:predicted phosphohydrolase
VEAQKPDCFILAGDVGHPLRLFQRGLELFERLSCPRLLVAGNHDVYRGEYDSRTLWEAMLPNVAQAAGFVWLEETALRLGSVGICGTMGWYDYSSSASHLPFAQLDYRRLKRLVNHDADYVDWPWSDQAMARYLGKRFVDRLAWLEGDAAVHSILVVTHMPIFDVAIPHYPQSEVWSLLRAYMGNLTIGDRVQGHRKVRHVVSGHVHRRGRWQVAGAGGLIDVHVVGGRAGELESVLLTLPD